MCQPSLHARFNRSLKHRDLTLIHIVRGRPTIDAASPLLIHHHVRSLWATLTHLVLWYGCSLRGHRKLIGHHPVLIDVLLIVLIRRWSVCIDITDGSLLCDIINDIVPFEMRIGLWNSDGLCLVSHADILPLLGGPLIGKDGLCASSLEAQRWQSGRAVDKASFPQICATVLSDGRAAALSHDVVGICCHFWHVIEHALVLWIRSEGHVVGASFKLVLVVDCIVRARANSHEAIWRRCMSLQIWVRLNPV